MGFWEIVIPVSAAILLWWWLNRHGFRRPPDPVWMLGSKDAGTGTPVETCPMKNGEPCCPDCGEPALLTGPSGGVSVNCACDNCHSEFNLGVMGGPPVVLDRMGKLSEGRARYYGITPEEIQRKKVN